MSSSSLPSPQLLGSVTSRLRAAGCVFAEDEAQLILDESVTPSDLQRMVRARVAGVPLEQILGWAQFYGLRIAIEPDVFVPRRRTEYLIARAVDLVRARSRPVVVLDLCCGSGALGLALASVVGPIELVATDVEPAAVRCARRNVGAIGGTVFQGDLFEPVPADLRGRIDILLANAPYVPTDAIALMPSEARDYEPHVTLDGGTDGTQVLRRVIAGAATWLAPGGHLLVESSAAQAPALTNAIAARGLLPLVTRSDDFEATVVIATKADPTD
jgi:release factor glutamine methyltransferase